MTGAPDWNELPKSSVTRLRIDRAYCSRMGSLVPSRSLRASTVCCDANGPRIVLPMSVGRTLAMTNTIVARSHSVTSDRARRRTKNRAIDDVAPP